jgi:hypothetical protein
MLFGETVAVYCENHTKYTLWQETHYVSAKEPNRLLLFGETIAVYCENPKKCTELQHAVSGPRNMKFSYIRKVKYLNENRFGGFKKAPG